MRPSSGVNRPSVVPRHPAPCLGDAVGVEDVRRARPAANALPERRAGRGAEPRARAGACRPRGGLRDPQREAPHRGHRRHERDPVLVDDRSQPEQQIGPERRRDEQVPAGEPGEEAVADEPVPEVGRQEAQRAAVGLEAEVLAKADPAGAQRPVRVHDALGLPVCPEVKRMSASSSSAEARLNPRRPNPAARLRLDRRPRRRGSRKRRRQPRVRAPFHTERRGRAQAASVSISKAVKLVSTGTTLPPTCHAARSSTKNSLQLPK